MERIDKILRALRADERERVMFCVEKILLNEVAKLDIKKLKGQKYFFRVRTGSVRIIFTKKGNDIRIVAIERRNESTYREF
jgi:mRNA-degrading endonuclease RelE of RelBE toxin-antitoxin system